MGSLRRRCVKVRKPSELRFGVVRRVGRGNSGDAACLQITSCNHAILANSADIIGLLTHEVVTPSETDDSSFDTSIQHAAKKITKPY